MGERTKTTFGRTKELLFCTIKREAKGGVDGLRKWRRWVKAVEQVT